MDGNLDALDSWANETLGKNKLPKDNPQAKDKIFRAAQRAKDYGYEIPDDIAEEFYDATALESGRSHYLADGKTVKTGARTPDGDFAIGFSQVMGNTAKPYKSKNLDPYKEEDNLIIGLNEFYNGDKSDPVGRRLAYVGGVNSPAFKRYKQTGTVSDGKLYSYLPNNKETFADYVRKSGGYNKLENWANQTLNGGNNAPNLDAWADGILNAEKPNSAPVEDVRVGTDLKTGLPIPKETTLTYPAYNAPIPKENSLVSVPETEQSNVTPVVADNLPTAKQLLVLTGADGSNYIQTGDQSNLGANEIRIRNSQNDKGGIAVAVKTIGADGKESFSIRPENAILPTNGTIKTRPQNARTNQNNNFGQAIEPTAEQLAQAAAEFPADDLSAYQPQQTIPPPKPNDVPSDVTVRVPLQKNQPIREALDDATRNTVLSSGYDVTGEDVDTALNLPKNRLKLADKSNATDTILSEAAKQGYIDHTIGGGIIRDALAAKDYRVKKEGINKRIESGELKGNAVFDAMQESGLIDEKQKAELIAKDAEQAKNEADAKARFETPGMADERTVAGAISTQYNRQSADSYLGEKESERKANTKAILDEYGSFINYEKVKAADNAEIEEYNKGSHPFGQPTEALKSAARYVAKIPATLIDTSAFAYEANPVTAALDYLNGADSKEVAKKMTAAADDWRKTIDNDLALKQNRVFKNDFIVNDVAEGLAQLTTQMILSPLTGGASLALPIAEAGTEQYKQALNSGANKATRLGAGIIGGLAAVPDVVLQAKYFRFLSPLEKSAFISKLTRGMFTKLSEEVGEQEAGELAKVTIKTFLKNSAVNGLGEFGQEWSEDVIDDTFAKLTYKPDLNLSDTFNPSDKKLRGYFAAGIGGLFGASVETVTEKMTTDELLQVHKSLPELLEENRISQAFFDKTNAEVETQIQKKGASTENTPQAEQSKTVKDFIEALPAEEKLQNSQAAPEKSIVGQTVNLKNKGQGTIVEDRGNKFLVDYNDGKSRAEFPKKQVELVDQSNEPAPESVESTEAGKSINTLADNPTLTVMKEKLANENKTEISESPAPVSTENVLPNENVVASENIKVGDRVDFNGNGTGTITKVNTDGSIHAEVDGRALPTVAQPDEFSVIAPLVKSNNVLPNGENNENAAVELNGDSQTQENISPHLQDWADGVLKAQKKETPLTNLSPIRQRAREKAGDLFKTQNAAPAKIGNTLTEKSGNLSRNFRAGTNDATLTFDSETQRDLYDLAAKEKYQMRGGQNKASGRAVGDIAGLKQNLIQSGVIESDLPALSRRVYDDVREQMKGVKHLEERNVADNVLNRSALNKIAGNRNASDTALQSKFRESQSKTELLGDVESQVDGDKVKVSLEGGEILRVASALISGKDINDEGLFSGMYFDKKDVANYTEALDELAKISEENGNDRATIDKLKNDIAQAASDSGTAIIDVYSDSVPHERIHQATDLGSDSKEYLDRYDAPEEIEGDTDFQTFHSGLNELENRTMSPGAAIEEAFAYLGTGDYERFGLTEDQAVGLLKKIVSSYVKKNGVESLKSFSKTEIRKVYESIEKENAGTESGSESGSIRGGGELGSEREVGREPSRTKLESGGAPEQSEQNTNSPKLKKRQIIVSAENSGLVEKGAITGDIRYYEEKSRIENERKAQDRIEEVGLSQAVADALNPNIKSTSEHAALQLEAVKLLNRQAGEAVKAGEAVAAKAKLDQATEIMLALAPEATNAGQFISQLASMNKTNPDTVAGYVQKSRAKKGYNESLTPEQNQALRETAEKLQSANARLAALENKISELEKTLANQDEKKGSIETKKGKTKPLTSVEKSVAENLQSKVEEAAKRLKDKFNPPALKQALKMLLPSKVSLDEQTLKDLSTVGADMLLTGLKGNPISVGDFRKSLIEQFGETIRPHAAEIHALSVKELQNIKSEAYRKRAVETLRNIKGNEDLTFEDLNRIVEKQIEERKEKAKVRAGHKIEADKFFNRDKIDAKERAREEKEQAKADLPSFAKSLFKVAATENKEVLLGAFYLETGQVKTADELARKLRESFPNLSSREALNASSLAARSRVLAHKDLLLEKSKLRTEKIQAISEAAEARKQRNEAQRILMRRISSLEKPPLGYAARIASVYKSALVSAVQTTVNNVLTAEGARKIETLSDLAEVAINKTLAKLGKEYDYQNKLGSKTRLQDVLGLPDREDYTSADIARHFFSDAVFARGIANSVLDEYPTLYEAMFGSYASDVEIMKERTGADNIADNAMRAVEKTFNAVNFLNQFQEFLVRSQEFNHALQMKIGQRGLNLADVVKNKQIAEKISEADLTFAINRALRVTFALKPDNESNFGRLTNLYQSSVPSIVSPFLVTFPNFMYNATKFVTDYAPAVGLAKAGYKAASSKNNSLGQNLRQEINPRVISQQLVGTALYLAALGLVRSAGDDDKWYYLRIPKTNYYLDVRGYQPFASFIFLANKTNRLIDGKTMFTDRDAAVSETLEAVTGLSTKNLTENKFASIIWRATLGRTGDGKDWERVSYLFNQQLGEIGGGFLRPLKTVKDLVASFDEYEAKVPDTTDRPGSQGIARSLPFANRILQLEPKKDFVTGKETSQPLPFMKIFGVNVVNPDYHKEIPSKALVMLREMTDNFQSEKDVLPESQRKAAVKSSLYRAMREAGDDEEKQKTVNQAIKRAEGAGILEANELEFMTRQKGLSELENLSKKAKYEQIGRAYAVAADSEKAALETIVQEKAEAANKRRDLTAKDVATIQKFMPDFQIDLKDPLNLLEKLKPVTTDKAVEMYLEKESDLSDVQKKEFKELIKNKAENSNKIGKLTDNEIDNIKKIIPDFQIHKKLSSRFEKLPSQFENKYESLGQTTKNLKKAVKEENTIRPFANFQNAPQSENVIDERDPNVVESNQRLARLARWTRQSENVIDKRPGSDFSRYLQAVRENNIEDIKFWNNHAKLSDAELSEINAEKIAQRKKSSRHLKRLQGD